MALLGFLKPAPIIKELSDQAEVKSKYRYWRIRTLYSMYIGYVFFYLTRKSFTFAMPVMIKDLGFDKTQMGILASILSLTYGASKFLSGIVSDRSNPRYFMSLGLILTGIFNIFFGLSSSLYFLAFFWGLNGWFQGWGWPPCAKLLTHWYSQKERGTWWSIWNTSHNLGGALIPLLGAFISAHWGWRMSMFAPGAACILMGLWLINRLRDTPQSLGLPPVEKFRQDYPGQKNAAAEAELSAKEILVEYVLKNKYIWLLSLSSFFIYVIRTAVNDWSMLYLVEGKGYTLMTAGITVCWFEVGGFCGSLFAGWCSDFFFKGQRGQINAIFALLILALVVLFWKMPAAWVVFDSIVIFFIGFFVFGPQMLIGVAAAELSHKKAAGTSTGFTGIFSYIGAAAAGGPLGKLMQLHGWEGFFLVLLVSAVLALVLLSVLWGVKSNFHKKAH
ncbi:MAG: MFS transporter family glucose-6-phosphate receptor UhpC [Parachlamydiales bacterium]|jgi:OPA family sugar phosphate sensor protein UhpC-like MFS transporter